MCQQPWSAIISNDKIDLARAHFMVIGKWPIEALRASLMGNYATRKASVAGRSGKT
ncbi:hypothetical protein GCM10007159_04970 [Modicisalibacter luteus]|nr:hypothetical protein GCM10007159_04970 [Halomonas lutea]